MLALSLLHPSAQLGWTSWSIHSSTVIGLAALAGLYEWSARRIRDRERPLDAGSIRGARVSPEPTPAQRLAFYAGLVVIFASLNGPLHDLSDYYLFSAHMVQHLSLTLVAPPLLLVGTPGGMLRPLLRPRVVRAVAGWLTRPTHTFVIFNVVLAAWHLPPLYNTAVAYHPVHVVQHLMFMAAAVLMWWPFLSPLPELPRLAYPGQMLYCFLMSIPMSIVSIYIVLADHVLYPAYASAPRVWGITPMEDQRIGGLIMWIPGSVFLYLVMTVVFFRWASRDGDDTATAQVDWPPAGATRP